MKSRGAFSIIESVLCIALLGILVSLSGHIFVSSFRAAAMQGNYLHASKAMRALSVLDGWSREALSAKAVKDADSFLPALYASMPVWAEGSTLIVFNFQSGAPYRALEVRDRGFSMHEWDEAGAHTVRNFDSMSIPASGDRQIYRSVYSMETCFGVPVLNLTLSVMRRSGGEFQISFKTGAENA